ncbi:MAG TPA: phosphatidate cytidylyltransferase [Clostridiales bacterium]|nr:phosphatidate cytidylyltransferase [Clostridiales bacterium]
MLGKRVLSGIVAVCIVILVFWVGSWLFDLALIIISLIGIREIYTAFSNKGINPQKAAGYIITALFYLQHYIFEGRYDLVFILTAIAMSMSLLVWNPSVKPVDMAVTIMGLFYPGIMLIVASLMEDSAFIHPYYLLILSLTATYAADTFAFFTGSLFGKHKLCPVISPKKTVEGSVGGLIGSVFFVLLVGIILNRVYNTDVSIIHFIVIGFLGGTFSQIGDLTASAIKRFCGLKDFGNILPGHGGIMDRIDSLLFVLPIIYLYSQLVLMG